MIQILFVDEGVAGIGQTLGTMSGLRERLNVLTTSLLTLPIDEQFTMLLRDRIKQQVTGLFQAARDAGEIRTDMPVEALVSLYMGMLRESKSIQGSRQASQLVAVLLDGIASPAQRDQ